MSGPDRERSGITGPRSSVVAAEPVFLPCWPSLRIVGKRAFRELISSDKLASGMRLTLMAINEHFAKLGFDARLEKGDRYFYFSSGEAQQWVNRTVNVPTVSSFTLEQWVDEYQRLKKLNQQVSLGQVTESTVEETKLTRDQKLWLLTADPNTLELAAEAPRWLIDECIEKGLVAHVSPDVSKLTAEGQKHWKALRGDE